MINDPPEVEAQLLIATADAAITKVQKLMSKSNVPSDAKLKDALDRIKLLEERIKVLGNLIDRLTQYPENRIL